MFRKKISLLILIFLTFFVYADDSRIDRGTTANRPSSPRSGYLYFNTTDSVLQMYDGSKWQVYRDLDSLQADIKAHISDSLHVVDDSTLEEYSNGRKFRVKDNGITWGKLATGVQSAIAGELYSYQDAMINSVLQMPVRWAHYYHEAHFDEDSVVYRFDYDQSNELYEVDRRGIVRYLLLLRDLHSLTGRSIYWNKMITLYQQILSVAVTETYKNGEKTCYTIPINPRVAESQNWIYADQRFHLVGDYIANQDSVNYWDYHTYAMDFADVFASYVDKETISYGWGWGYTWDNTVMVSDERINVEAPSLTWWQYMNSQGYSTDSLTTTYIDSLCDSTWAILENSWVDGTGGFANSGGYELRIGDGTIDAEYNGVYVIEYNRIMSFHEDTTWAFNCGKRIELLAKYQLMENSTNYSRLMNYYSYVNSIAKKLADLYNIDWAQTGDKYGQNAVADFIWSIPFDGTGWHLLSTPEAQRRAGLFIFTFLAELVNSFNDVTFNENFVSLVDPDGWDGNASTFFYGDGIFGTDRYYCGLAGITSSFFNQFGFYHNDALGTATHEPDTTYWAMDANKVVKYFLPDTSKAGGDTLDNGLFYTIKKPMGKPFKIVTPSVADSIGVLSDTLGNASTDSIYYFYYNTSGIIDTVSAQNFSTGDSIVFKGDYGFFMSVIREDAAVAAKNYIGFICNEPTFKLYNRGKTGTSNLYVTGLCDSAMFANFRHEISNGYLYSTAISRSEKWERTFKWAEDVLYLLKNYWDNAVIDNNYGYEGILTDKR